MGKRWRLKNMRLDRVDLVTAGANPGAHVLIAKFEEPADIDVSNVVEPSDIVEVQPVSDAAEPVEAPDAPASEVEMSEEPTAEVVDTVAKADFEALQKSLEDARAEITKMNLERKQAEYVAKAREFDNIGKADELGSLLLTASEAFTAEQYQALERLLKAANAQLEKGDLFAQFSRPDADSPDVMDRINTLAKAKVEAGEAKTLEIAKQMVLRENRELQSEYMSARSAL